MHVNSSTGGSEPENFMEIWAHNLEEGFEKIRRIVQSYPYVAMVSCGCSLHFSYNISVILVRTQSSQGL